MPVQFCGKHIAEGELVSAGATEIAVRYVLLVALSVRRARIERPKVATLSAQYLLG